MFKIAVHPWADGLYVITINGVIVSDPMEKIEASTRVAILKRTIRRDK